MLAALIFILYLIPVIFQFNYGNKAINGFIRLKFWHICLISTFIQGIMIIINFFLISITISNSEVKCGLPAIGIAAIGILIWIFVVVVMVIQLFVKLTSKNN